MILYKGTLLIERRPIHEGRARKATEFILSLVTFLGVICLIVGTPWRWLGQSDWENSLSVHCFGGDPSRLQIWSQSFPRFHLDYFAPNQTAFDDSESISNFLGKGYPAFFSNVGSKLRSFSFFFTAQAVTSEFDIFLQKMSIKKYFNTLEYWCTYIKILRMARGKLTKHGNLHNT